MASDASAAFGGVYACGLEAVSDERGALDGGGRWMVALPYAGRPVLARFAHWSVRDPAPAGRWRGPEVSAWASSMEAEEYEHAVERVRETIAAGTVYQANLCRVLRAALPDPDACDVTGLHRLLVDANPAPYGGYLQLPSHGVGVVSASPELFLEVGVEQGERWARSGPIKGTGATPGDLTDKDRAENVMIVDLVRNDLSRVSVPGSVSVPDLLRVEHHPGLVHLVSTVRGVLQPGVSWSGLLDATFPPGSVTGAPKSSALRVIAELEPVPREFYCGAFGWIDADTGTACMAVAIRTFWVRDGMLHFGTGAGITWGSSSVQEWQETELKARHLIGVAAGTWEGVGA